MTRFYLQFLFASFIPVPPAVVVITDFRQFFNLLKISVAVVRYIEFFYDTIFPFFFISSFFIAYFLRLFLSLVFYRLFFAFFFRIQSKPTAITQTSAAGSLFWILLRILFFSAGGRWGGQGYLKSFLFFFVLQYLEQVFSYQKSFLTWQNQQMFLPSLTLLAYKTT